MRTAIVSFMKITDNQKLPASKIAFWFAKTFGSEIIQDYRDLNKKYDAIFLINGIPVWCKERDNLYKFISNCTDNLIWLGNDILLNHRPQIRNLCKRFIVMAAYENFRDDKNYFYANLNSITTDNVQMNHGSNPIKGLFYYGSFRDDRVKYFEKYFAPNAEYPINVSALGKSEKEYYEINKKIKFYNLNHDLIGSINKFESTLYIEDEKSHRVYSSPANRFYESISAGIPIAFCRSTLGTFKKAGIHLQPDWIVDSAQNMSYFIKNARILGESQKVLFKDYKMELIDQVKFALEKII